MSLGPAEAPGEQRSRWELSEQREDLEEGHTGGRAQ